MRRTPLAIALLAALVLAAFGWGALRATTSAASTAQKEPVTISFWSPFTARELGVLNKRVRRFPQEVSVDHGEEHRQHEPDKLTAAIRGGNAPDAVALFETDTLGAFCASGALLDLARTSRVIKLNMNLFPKTIRDYTAYENKRCALPLLADAYGFYYNKRLFAKAGIKAPPKTLAQLSAYAKKLTSENSDGSIKVLGFNPLMNWYENSPATGGPDRRDVDEERQVEPRRRSRLGRAVAVAEDPRRLVRLQEPREVAG